MHEHEIVYSDFHTEKKKNVKNEKTTNVKYTENGKKLYNGVIFETQ